MAPDHVDKTVYSKGKSLEFVADWLEKNSLSKLKSVFESMFIINFFINFIFISNEIYMYLRCDSLTVFKILSIKI